MWLSEFEFAPVIPFSETDRFFRMDFSASNASLAAADFTDTEKFTDWVNVTLKSEKARYGIGGYLEDRIIYRRSRGFDGDGGEPRHIHLGIDIWGSPYTKVMAPLDGIVHSFAFNNAFGDYGATIILSHRIGNESFHTLYGHLSLNSLSNLHEGDVLKKGDVIAGFGIPFENGQWPPHLHFQLIKDMEERKGDYPGVCSSSMLDHYSLNCPDPDLILRLMHRAS